MAIVIPSKRIYGITNNKILDNAIKGISFSQSKTKLLNGELFSISFELYETTTNNDGEITGVADVLESNISDTFVIKEQGSYFTSTGTIIIVDSDCEWYRGYFIIKNSGYVVKGTNGKIVIKYSILFGSSNGSFTEIGDMSEFPNVYENIEEYENYDEFVASLSNGGQIKFGYERVDNNTIYLFFNDQKNHSTQISFGDAEGNVVTSYLTHKEISFVCDLVDVKDESKNIGSGNNVFSLPNNELLQDSTKIGGVEIGEYLAQKVIDAYKKGKETAIVKCSINDYYTDAALPQKAIGIGDVDLPIAFRMYDEVIPMICTPKGDIPMSKTATGAAKVFKVIGSEIINNGAVWQELTLVEK